MSKNAFRPMYEPARSIYDALQKEAKKRHVGDPDNAWILRERLAVWKAARNYSQAHGLQVLSLDDIEYAEDQCQSCGPVDYWAKWAYAVRDKIWELKEAQMGKLEELLVELDAGHK